MKNATLLRSFLLSVVIAACGGDSSGPTGDTTGNARMEILAGSGATAAVNPTQFFDLRVRFVEKSGVAIANEPFVLEMSAPQFFELTVNQDARFEGSATALLRTNEAGSVALRIFPFTKAGRAVLRFRMTAKGILDSVVYNMLPGEPAKVALTPKDTAVYRGSVFTPRAVVTDEWGNAISGSATLASRSTAITVSGSSATAVDYGRAIVAASTTVGGKTFSDSSFVSIVPRIKIASRDQVGFLSLNNLDGSTVVYPSFGGRRGSSLSRAPSGDLLTISESAGPATLIRYASNGLVFPVSTNRTFISDPAMSKDGQWIYYLSPNIGIERLNLLTNTSETIPVRQSLMPLGTIALSPSSDNIAYGNALEGFLGGIEIRDLKTGAVTRVYEGGVEKVLWSPDGKTIAALAGNIIKFIRLSDLSIRTLNQGAYRGSWSSDSEWLIVSGPELLLIRVATLEVIPIKTVLGSEPTFLDW